MRAGLYRFTKKADRNDQIGRAYNIFISIVAVLSVIPLMFKQDYYWLTMIDRITVYILFCDYMFRWLAYDFATNRKKWWIFCLYPISPLAIFDMVSLLPSLGILSPSFRILRLLRITKLLRYSETLTYILNVFRKQKKILMSVLLIAVGYIFVSAMFMFSTEPQSFDNFFEALYWATTALTTVGYGDVYPITNGGRLVSMISSLFGIAVIALPSGIVTGGIIQEYHDQQKVEDGSDLDDIDITKAGGNFFLKNKTIRRYALIMTMGVAMNIVLFFVSIYFGWPCWLDITGTIMVTILLEPAAGIIVALLNNCIISVFTLGSEGLFFSFVGASVALVVGLLVRNRKNKVELKRFPLAFLVGLLVGTIMDSIVILYVLGALNFSWEIDFYNTFINQGYPREIAVLFACGIIKIVDFSVSLVIALIAFMFSRSTKKYDSKKNS